MVDGTLTVLEFISACKACNIVYVGALSGTRRGGRSIHTPESEGWGCHIGVVIGIGADVGDDSILLI